MDTTKTVHVIDDDDLLCESVARLLALNGYSVHQHSSADAFLAFQAQCDPATPAIVVSDVRMPGCSGVGLLKELRRRAAGNGRTLPVILVTGHASVPLAVEAMRDGAAHFLEKPVDPDLLLATVRAACESLVQERPHDDAAQARLKDLTPRERQVLAAFVARGSNKAVANALRMSPRTVEVHRTRIFRKSGATSVTELVRIAIEAGVVDPLPGPAHQ
ncbi:response regulator [Roseomonas eburnea]|uniref:Response regulator n=1 Tax=Neoroseomonas eburnea TaxID=1346889 RepID=A0A9X9X5R1_9PROT|nr:response regulator [Neoroseomonas eburnea]MBR0679047.1 response regulator [Neoroseomonas eburnea]